MAPHQYWQVAAGNVSAGRDYAYLFLKHGLAFVGGEPQVSVASDVCRDDVILLKDGMHKILAAGRVVERDGRVGGRDDKEWLRDIEGWDLRAYLFVEWRYAPSPITTSGLTRATISRTNIPEHHAIAERLLKCPIFPIEPEPGRPNILAYGDIIADLRERNPSIETELGLELFEKLRRTYDDDFELAMKWSAGETRDELVRPLLHALGWSEKHLRDDAVGAGLSHVLCCFPKERRNSNVDVKVVECRPFYHGVDLSPEQSHRIGKVFTGARALAVTNGIALKLYSRPEHGPFKTEPSAYVNLAKPAERCPFDPTIHGALTALRFLAKPA